MECFVHADKKYFPEYNWFEKAISYPYKAPTTSFTFKNGKFYQGIHISLKDRIPILSIGSNRSPYQLKNKFLNILMTRSFNYGLNKIADSFQKRAEELFGNSKNHI